VFHWRLKNTLFIYSLIMKILLIQIFSVRWNNNPLIDSDTLNCSLASQPIILPIPQWCVFSGDAANTSSTVFHLSEWVTIVWAFLFQQYHGENKIHSLLVKLCTSVSLEIEKHPLHIFSHNENLTHSNILSTKNRHTYSHID
jgi:hypothetical protein